MCKYEINELLNQAIITQTPVVIVEGTNDIKLYDEIVKVVPFDIDVYAIEHVKGYSEGCEQVIRAIEELNQITNNKHKLSNYMLGIIDKDVRDYRQEIPKVQPLLVLKYYSIESHFISINILPEITALVIRGKSNMFDHEVYHSMMQEIEQAVQSLYYFSLEALHNAMDPNYNSEFSYSYPAGRLGDLNAKNKIEQKQDYLNDFASNLGIKNSINTIKIIANGKWLLDMFASTFLNILENLKDKCANNEINRCISCSNGSCDKCMYRIEEGFTKKTIKNLILSNVRKAEIDYIVDRIKCIR